MLKNTFFNLVRKYNDDPQLIENLWSEIQIKYSKKSRHYHTLSHLEQLIHQLNDVKHQIADWDTVLFAVYYHDIIYKATKNDNEEKSAELAKQRLEQLNYPNDKTIKCIEMILATKKHTATGDPDTDHFTDADLSILGQSWDTYQTYLNQIRKEYSIYPDLIYNPGRKKVLHHLLKMERIYKTDHFFIKYEKQARKNLSEELTLL